MKVLLDECIPRKFKYRLPGHDCRTVPEAGWSGTKNGDVLWRADRSGFEVFLTLDKGIPFEQNLAGLRIAVIVIRTGSNRPADLLTHAPACLLVPESVQPGQVTLVGS